MSAWNAAGVDRYSYPTKVDVVGQIGAEAQR